MLGTGWAMAQSVILGDASVEAMILTSASSRTAHTAAFSAKLHAEDGGRRVATIGLTSPANLEMTRELGFYDEVVTYEEVSAMPRRKIAIMSALFSCLAVRCSLLSAALGAGMLLATRLCCTQSTLDSAMTWSPAPGSA